MKIRTLIALIGSGLNALGFTILMVSYTWFAFLLLATGSAGILLYFLFNFLDENNKSQPQQPQLQQQQQQWQATATVRLSTGSATTAIQQSQPL